MNKFKVGDIVLATAGNDEFVDNESLLLFKVLRAYSQNSYKYITISNYIIPKHTYFEYKFRKATKKEIKKFNFNYIVNKLKGDLINE